MITRIQGPKRGCLGNSSSLTLTLDNTPTDGNVLIAVIGTYGSYPPAVDTISQSSGTVTWAKQVSSSSWSLYGRNVEIWAGVVQGSVSPTLTVTLRSTGSGANSDPVIADICEYNGLETSNFLDKTTTSPTLGYYTRTLTTGATDTTTCPTELWIGGIFNVCNLGNGEGDSSPTNGFELLDGIGAQYGGQTKSLAYLEKKVSTLGIAWSGCYGGSFSTYEAYTGCMATFKGIVNNDNHLWDNSKWEIDTWDDGENETPSVFGYHEAALFGSEGYVYYDAIRYFPTNGYWGNTEYEQSYDIFRDTPWGSVWASVPIQLTAPNQSIDYSAKLTDVGGAWDGKGNAYINLWIMFSSGTGNPGNGDPGYQYAEIQIFTHKSGDPLTYIGKTTTELRNDAGKKWYFIGYHATNLSTSSYTSQTVNLNTLINLLQSTWGCNLNIGGVTGITFGVECSKSYIGAIFDYLTYHY